MWRNVCFTQQPEKPRKTRHGNILQRRDPSPKPGLSGLHSGGGATRKRQRRDPTPQPGPSTLQSDADDPRKQRRDSSPQAGPSNLQSAASDPIRRTGNRIFPCTTIFKDIDFVKNEHNLNIVYQRYISKNEADEIFDELEIEYFPPEMAKMVIYNKKYSVARKVSAYSDKNLTYTFFGNTLPTKPLIPILTKISNEANKFLKESSFNYVLINRYKDGYDKIGSHKDNDNDMDPDSSIVTFLFGAERTIIFKRPNFDSVKIPLKNGSVLVMYLPTNEFWFHEIPREKNIEDVRISLTFRKNLLKKVNVNKNEFCFFTCKK
ncbi:DNA oxidative demethylase ALKBH2 [Araneus ventricosus]|uniref:DNA oxidative demethylase ALKBH2 n=1 Tax=Araneus ventricosus TaxID=182803 RepID=A0A4Y2KGE5_ARAVE|nr:DNA oxidative demethylase ALKBH2 [Araneus ventricosus]GBN01398.1 DNA oxidative demethylase ALKBH2 [Araneus ventricosus]